MDALRVGPRRAAAGAGGWGDAIDFPGDPEFLRAHGVEVVVGDDPGCKELLARFIREWSELWREDIAGREEV